MPAWPLFFNTSHKFRVIYAVSMSDCSSYNYLPESWKRLFSYESLISQARFVSRPISLNATTPDKEVVQMSSINSHHSSPCLYFCHASPLAHPILKASFTPCAGEWLTHFDWGLSSLIFPNIVPFQRLTEFSLTHIQAMYGVSLLPQP